MRFPDFRVRHADGRLGVIPAGTDPEAGPKGYTVWPVMWTDGTSSTAEDDDLTVLP